MRRDGHDVFVADTGNAALTIARAKAPDAVLFDLTLPDGHGDTIARSLRQDILQQGAAIIVVSNREVFDHLHAHLVDLHLTKPVELELLSGLIHYVLDKRRPSHVR